MPQAKMKARRMPAHLPEKQPSQDLSALTAPKIALVPPGSPTPAKMKAKPRPHNKDSPLPQTVAH